MSINRHLVKVQSHKAASYYGNFSCFFCGVQSGDGVAPGSVIIFNGNDEKKNGLCICESCQVSFVEWLESIAVLERRERR